MAHKDAKVIAVSNQKGGVGYVQFTKMQSGPLETPVNGLFLIA